VKLGTLLLRNAAIGLSQLESALRNQVLYGGRLGTNLVELGLIDLETLSAYLGELTGLPIATPTLLEGAEPKLLQRLGADDAHRLRAIPLGHLAEGDIVAVAFVDPADTAAVAHVAERLDAHVVPYVVPELRALYYLEKHYGLPRRPRFVRPGRTDTDRDVDLPERRRSQPPGGMELPPSFTLEPRRKRASTQGGAGGRAPVAVSYEGACDRIDAAPHRERIADVFSEYARGRFDALVVFLMRDGNAIGWRGYVAPQPGPAGAAPASAAPASVRPPAPIEELSLPLAGASSLQSVHDTGQPYIGPPPATAHPTETRLWTALGTTEPAGLAVAPIQVKQRVVNLVYAHTLAAPMPPALAAELTELAARAEAAYLRLIRQARGS
jgi:Type II secretion system (T2SS), protein E, N-terminal domain